jgi:hypothetical protein
MKKTVAIIGTHPDTSKQFDFDRTDCDIWVFNEALKEDYFKRADGVFQIHKPTIWRSSTNRNDPNHYQYLKSQTESIIYMQDKYNDVPLSERYPLQEILDRYPTAKRYFTSSVAYALALAIYKGYTKIEVYGVEMETNTEYAEQRPGVAYWVGFANGLGIEVDFHSKSFFRAPLYGYDGDTYILVEHYEWRINELAKHVQGAYEAMADVQMKIAELLGEFVKSYKTNLEPLDEYVMALGQNALNQGMYRGASDLNLMYMAKCYKMQNEGDGTYLVVRQEYEGYMQQAGKKLAGAKDALNQIGIALKGKRDNLNTNENKKTRMRLVEDFQKGLYQYVRASTEFGRLTGQVKESQLLLKQYDERLKAAGYTTKDERMQPVEAVHEEVEVLV